MTTSGVRAIQSLPMQINAVAVFDLNAFTT